MKKIFISGKDWRTMNNDLKSWNAWQSERQAYANKTRGKLVQSATYTERIMKNVLRSMGIQFIFQKVVFGKGYNAFIDFFILKPFYGVCLEIDGKMFHGPDRQYQDLVREDRIKENHPNFRFVRMTNADVLSGYPKQVLARKLKEIGCDTSLITL